MTFVFTSCLGIVSRLNGVMTYFLNDPVLREGAEVCSKTSRSIAGILPLLTPDSPRSILICCNVFETYLIRNNNYSSVQGILETYQIISVCLSPQFSHPIVFSCHVANSSFEQIAVRSSFTKIDLASHESAFPFSLDRL